MKVREVLIAVCIAAVLAGVAWGQTKVSAPATGPVGRFQVTDTSAGPMLVDSVKGDTWRLCQHRDEKNAWCYVPKAGDIELHIQSDASDQKILQRLTKDLPADPKSPRQGSQNTK